jgi:hypothetical protein
VRSRPRCLKLCRAPLSPIPPPTGVTEISFRPNSLDGVFKHLSDRFGGNPHLCGIVNVTASSVYDDKSHNPENVFESNHEKSYISASGRPSYNEWICVDFKKMRVKPTHYAIQSCRHGWAGNPRSWVITISNDGNSWTEVDRHEDNNDLSENYLLKSYSVHPCEPCQYVRFHQTKGSSSYLAISGFELFGSLID